jgi:hypothetical protein
MAKLIGNELPNDLYNRLSGNNLEMYAEKVIPAVTVDANSWPHPAMLTYLEVVAKDRRNIRLAPYKNSNTTNNMRRNGKLTMLIIDERIIYYIKGSVEEIKNEMTCSPHISKLNMRVEQVLTDQTDEQIEAGVYVVSGVTYKNPNMATELLKAKEVLKELLE